MKLGISTMNVHTWSVKAFCLLGLIVNFLFGGCKMYADDYVEQGEMYFQQVIDDFAQEAEGKLGLLCIGSGGGMPGGVISQMGAMFIMYSKGTIEEARRLEVEASEMFLKRINEHEKIRPYLNNHPFFSIKVTVSFRKPDNNTYTDGSIVYASNINNCITYYAEDCSSPIRKILAKEPYEEARKIVLNQKRDAEERAHKMSSFEKEVSDQIDRARKEFGFYDAKTKHQR